MPKADDIEARFKTAGHFTEGLKKGKFALFCQPIVLNGWSQKLTIVTIAESVEHAETLSVLRKIGVNFAQGFGIALPMSLSQIS
jgi:EAL domain-containing protein (putative c-di-GMP-specific phosphodiesterase class I)